MGNLAAWLIVGISVLVFLRFIAVPLDWKGIPWHTNLLRLALNLIAGFSYFLSLFTFLIAALAILFIFPTGYTTLVDLIGIVLALLLPFLNVMICVSIRESLSSRTIVAAIIMILSANLPIWLLIFAPSPSLSSLVLAFVLGLLGFASSLLLVSNPSALYPKSRRFRHQWPLAQSRQKVARRQH